MTNTLKEWREENDPLITAREERALSRYVAWWRAQQRETWVVADRGWMAEGETDRLYGRAA